MNKTTNNATTHTTGLSTAVNGTLILLGVAWLSACSSPIKTHTAQTNLAPPMTSAPMPSAMQTNLQGKTIYGDFDNKAVDNETADNKVFDNKTQTHPNKTRPSDSQNAHQTTKPRRFTCDKGTTVDEQKNALGLITLTVHAPTLSLNHQTMQLKQTEAQIGKHYLNDANPDSIYEWQTKDKQGIFTATVNGNEYSYLCQSK